MTSTVRDRECHRYRHLQRDADCICSNCGAPNNAHDYFVAGLLTDCVVPYFVAPAVPPVEPQEATT